MSLDGLSHKIRTLLPEVAEQISPKQLHALIEVHKRRKINHGALQSILRTHRDKGQASKFSWGEDGSSKMNVFLNIIDQHVKSVERQEKLPDLAEKQLKTITEKFGRDNLIDSQSLEQILSLFEEMNPEPLQHLSIEEKSAYEQMRILENFFNYFYLLPRKRYYTIEDLDERGIPIIKQGSFTVLDKQENPHPSLNASAKLYTLDNYRNHATTIGDIAIISDTQLKTASQSSTASVRKNATASVLFKRQSELYEASTNENANETFLQFASQEELQHAFDYLTIGHFQNAHPAIIKGTISSATPLLRRESDLLIRAEEAKQKNMTMGDSESNSDWKMFRAILEFSGQVKGAIEAMKIYLNKGELDNAYNVFLMLINMYAVYVRRLNVGKVSAYAVAADWMFTEYPHRTKQEIEKMERAILNLCESAGDMHPAEKGLEFLESQHYKHFLRPEEQRQRIMNA